MSTQAKALDEESRQILRRIVESLAWRQLASMNTLGHCLKFVGELEVKVAVAQELELALRLFRRVHALYGDLGWRDLESAVRERVEAMEYPASRLEFGVAYYLFGVAENVAMSSYMECACEEFASIAREHVAASQRRPEPRYFLEYCTEPTHRPQAQQFLDRWATLARMAFGRPGAPAGRRAMELGLRKATSAELDAEFRRVLAPFLVRCGLNPLREPEGAD